MNTIDNIKENHYSNQYEYSNVHSQLNDHCHDNKFPDYRHCPGNAYPGAAGYGNNDDAFLSTREKSTGRVLFPTSRAQYLVNLGLLTPPEADAMVGGKNFPDHFGGPVQPPYQDDVRSAVPPEDVWILSGGHRDYRAMVNLRNQDMTLYLGRPFSWPVYRVNRGETLNIQWTYSIPQTTRGYRAFITKDNWSDLSPIMRLQLEPTPFFELINRQIPFWAHKDQLQPRGTTPIRLPNNKRGYHVIVILWLIASSPNAVFQAIDVDFG